MGYSPEEMTTDPKCWPDHLHPEDAPRVFEEMHPLIARGGGSVEYRFRHRDGHYIWIQDTFKVVNDEAGHPLELVGAWADITESKEPSRRRSKPILELQDTKRYLTRLIESSTDAIIATDKEGNVVLFNEGAETLLGYRADDVIGQPAVRALCQRGARQETSLREMRKRGGTVAGFESVLKSKDGTSIPGAHLGFGPVRRAGRGGGHGRLRHRPSRRASARKKSSARRMTNWRSASTSAPPS